MLFDLWTELAPVTEKILWEGQPWLVDFHMITVDEEMDLLAQVATYPEEQQLVAERMTRVAWSIESANGNIVPWGRETAEDRGEREAWVKRLDGTLLFLLCEAYEVAANKPILAAQEMRADPSSAAGPSTTGASSRDADGPAGSVTGPGPSSSSTPSTTRPRKQRAARS